MKVPRGRGNGSNMKIKKSPGRLRGIRFEMMEEKLPVVWKRDFRPDVDVMCAEDQAVGSHRDLAPWAGDIKVAGDVANVDAGSDKVGVRAGHACKRCRLNSVGGPAAPRYNAAVRVAAFDEYSGQSSETNAVENIFNRVIEVPVGVHCIKVGLCCGYLPNKNVMFHEGIPVEITDCISSPQRAKKLACSSSDSEIFRY